MNKKVKILVLMGQAADKIAKAWGQHIEIKRCKDMKEAISTAYSFADENDIVLLSPACASFDMYENYEHRGNVFKQEVALL